MRVTTAIKTASGSSYIGKLCRHFKHKIETEYSAQNGVAHFPAGICNMSADPEHLFFEILATDPEGVATIKGVLERHLVKFAYKETLTIDWVEHSNSDSDA